jgi:hypothetical protein
MIVVFYGEFEFVPGLITEDFSGSIVVDDDGYIYVAAF